MKQYYNFFFDYIFYRITKAYMKWDGNSGITSIIAIVMIKLLIVVDVFVLLLAVFYKRSDLSQFNGITTYGKVVIVIIFIGLLIHTTKKYSNRYQDLATYWSGEPAKLSFQKGMFVILSMILPWVPLLGVGAFW